MEAFAAALLDAFWMPSRWRPGPVRGSSVVSSARPSILQVVGSSVSLVSTWPAFFQPQPVPSSSKRMPGSIGPKDETNIVWKYWWSSGRTKPSLPTYGLMRTCSSLAATLRASDEPASCMAINRAFIALKARG